MVGREHLHLNSRTQNVRSTRNIESLPDELLSEILVRVPADDLYNKARLVCCRWNTMIRSDAFVKAHLGQSSTNYGLLLSYNYYRLIYVCVTNQGKIEISNLGCKCISSSSSNGLVSGMSQCSRSNRRRVTPPFVLNPTTKQAFDIATFDSEGQFPYTYCIAYAAASMVYKVVQPCFPGHPAILSVGVDNSWRRVQHLPSDARNLPYIPTPLITEGYIHWVLARDTQKVFLARDTQKVLTMNVETEIITETTVPFPRTHREYYLSTGRYLTLLVYGDDYEWNVWEMKPAESGEWKRQRYNIKFEDQQLVNAIKCNCKDLQSHRYMVRPVGWVKYPEFLAFSVSCADTFIFYNLRTHQIDSTTGLPRGNHIYYAFPHRKTLVRLS